MKNLVKEEERELLEAELEEERKINYEREKIADQDKLDIIVDSRS